MNQNVRTSIETLHHYPFHVNANLRVFYVAKGSIEFRFVSGVWKYAEGSLEIINVNEPVEIRGVDKENVVLILELSHDFVKKYLPKAHIHRYNSHVSLFYMSSAEQMSRQILKRKFKSILLKTAQMKQVSNAQLVDLLVFLDEHFQDVRNIFKDEDSSEIDKERFTQINEYILEHIDEKISLSQISDMMYLSSQYLSNEFKNKTEQNFKSIVDFNRVIYSVQQLLLTQDTVKAIAMRSGFSSVNYFYKQFKSYLDCTPVQFRKITSHPAVKESHFIDGEDLNDLLEGIK